MIRQALILPLLATCLSFSIASASSHGSVKSVERSTTSKALDYFFFPYGSCLLLTIHKVTPVIEKPYMENIFQDSGSVTIEGKIEDVLRGTFQKGHMLTLKVGRKPLAVDLGRPLDGIVGTQCVLAFNDEPNPTGLWTSATYAPFPDQHFSLADVECLKHKLQASEIYPYWACLKVTIKEACELPETTDDGARYKRCLLQVDDVIVVQPLELTGGTWGHSLRYFELDVY